MQTKTGTICYQINLKGRTIYVWILLFWEAHQFCLSFKCRFNHTKKLTNVSVLHPVLWSMAPQVKIKKCNFSDYRVEWLLFLMHLGLLFLRSWSLEHMDKPSWERELALCERYLGTFYCTVLRELESGVRANNGWLWICNMLKCAMVAVQSCLPYTPPPLLTIARSCTLDNILVIFINIINHLQVLETRWAELSLLGLPALCCQEGGHLLGKGARYRIQHF